MIQQIIHCTAAMDYVEVRETVVFEPEVTEQNLTLTLVNDDILEEDEVFLVELSIQEGAPVTLLDTTRVTSITILNDDSMCERDVKATEITFF